MTDIKLLKTTSRRLEILASMNITTLEDLIYQYPYRYEVIEEKYPTDEDEHLIIEATVISPVKIFFKGKMSRMSFEVEDKYLQHFQVSIFNRHFLRQHLKLGTTITIIGKCVNHRITASDIKIKPLQDISGIYPVYSLKEGITQKSFRQYVKKALSLLNHEFDDFIPEKYRIQHHLIRKESALYCIHFPENKKDIQEALKYLKYEEFLKFQLTMQLIKQQRIQEIGMAKDFDVTVFQNWILSLPFPLTTDQQKAIKDIVEDLKSPHMMYRFLQGDVGSGKTILAFLAMIMAAENGYQAALMVPTEVLARQHYDAFCRLIQEQGLAISPVLLTGSNTAKEKRERYEEIASAKAAIIIGTHALIQEKVQYQDLALVITDEQHRFGVKQREALTTKGNPPNVLVMSATPIPRTLAIILYGDLDISVIDELPAKRLPIKNCVVDTSYRPKAYSFIEKQVREGHQAYIICPMVEESEEMEAENVLDYTEKIKGIFPPSVRISYLHGKMKAKEKNQIMEAFASGEIQILVSTTVVEVGVNVPNATVMMIENAERFGLAQLHQLRGRVGRGDWQSYCIFMQGSGTQETKKRLEILNRSNDGFYIAGEDLKLRGPGDLFGIRQSGSMEFKIGDIYNDAGILKEASDAAAEILALDRDLALPQHARLKEELLKYMKNDLENLGL